MKARNTKRTVEGYTIAAKIPVGVKARLERVIAVTGHNQSEFVREALVSQCERYERHATERSASDA